MRSSYFLFANSRRFFAFAAAEIIQSRATGFAFGLDLDLGDARRINRENALDPFAVGNAPHGEHFIQTATLTTDHDSGKDLDSLLISLDHASMHANAVSNFELGGVLLLLFFNEIDDPVHKLRPWGGKGVHFAVSQAKSKWREFVIVDPAIYNRGFSRS